MLLLDRSAQDLQAALGDMERKARDANLRGERAALVVYYSGHAKDGALRLGDTRLPLESLKARIAAGPGRRAHRHLRLVPLGRADAHQGRPQGARLRDRIRRARATPRAS